MKKVLLLAVVGGLLAGCQSERVAFQFQPVAPLRVAAPVSEPAAAGAPAAAAALATLPAAPRSLRMQRRLARVLPRVLAVPRATPLAGAGTSGPPVAKPRLLPRLAWRPAGRGGAAESGLGSIGAFFIAVVLGLLAGLAALVALIPGVSFWGGLGLAVAGLAVLFLVYSLLSGGHKKKS